MHVQFDTYILQRTQQVVEMKIHAHLLIVAFPLEWRIQRDRNAHIRTEHSKNVQFKIEWWGTHAACEWLEGSHALHGYAHLLSSHSNVSLSLSVRSLAQSDAQLFSSWKYSKFFGFGFCFWILNFWEVKNGEIKITILRRLIYKKKKKGLWFFMSILLIANSNCVNSEVKKVMPNIRISNR